MVHLLLLLPVWTHAACRSSVIGKRHQAKTRFKIGIGLSVSAENEVISRGDSACLEVRLSNHNASDGTQPRVRFYFSRFCSKTCDISASLHGLLLVDMKLVHNSVYAIYLQQFCRQSMAPAPFRPNLSLTATVTYFDARLQGSNHPHEGCAQMRFWTHAC